MRSQPCVICGADLFTYSAPLKYLHCINDECTDAFALRELRRLGRPEGDHLIWSGPLSKGVPTVYLRGTRRGKTRQRSARKLAVIQAGEVPGHNDSFVVTCEHQLCVKHIKVQRAAPVVKRSPEPRFNVEPLVRRIDRLPPMQREKLRQSAAKGYLTVEQVDLYCIKYLDTHPCMIYGPGWFAA